MTKDRKRSRRERLEGGSKECIRLAGEGGKGTTIKMDGLTMGPGREIVVTAIGIGSGSRGGGHVL